MSTIRVLLADDHALVRSGLRMLLQSIDGVEVVGEAQDGRNTLKLVKTLRPNIVLLDISMPGIGGIEISAQIKRRFPKTRVLIISMHAEEEYVEQALRSGVSGYLLKDATPMELEHAVKAVARGEIYLCPPITRTIVDRLIQSENASQGPLGLLTPRQRTILRLIAGGSNSKQIAAALGVSIKTAANHRARLMERLGIHEVAGLVRFAVRVGLVSEDE